MTTTIIRNEQVYTSCYCEENIYMMCKAIAENNPSMLDRFTVVFISNPTKTVPLWMQKSCQGDFPVIWDYHVILYYNDDNDRAYIYDLDTELAFPCSAEEYTIQAFKPELQLKQEYQRYFRLVPANDYLREFASDRSHMLKEDGTYISSPPLYPPIATGECTMNLQHYIDMIDDDDSVHGGKYGVVVDESEFYRIALNA